MKEMKKTKKNKPSSLETKFIDLWSKMYPNLLLEREMQLIPKRKFRFDFVHLKSKTTIELQGGLYVRGGHSRGRIQERDYEKNLLALQNGYVIIYLGTKQITEDFLQQVKNVIELRF